MRLIWHKPAVNDEALTNRRVSADRTVGDSSFIGFEPNGSIQIVNQNGSIVNIDAENGNISIVQQDGTSVNLTASGVSLVDSEGNLVSVGGDVTIVTTKNINAVGQIFQAKTGSAFIGDGANRSVPLGEDLLIWLNTHTHATPAGPSGPPVPLATSSLLSSSVKVKS